MVRPTAIAVLLGMLALQIGCGGGGGGRHGGAGLPASLAERYPIDGQVDLNGFTQIYQRSVDLQDGIGTGSIVASTTLRWAIANDDRDIYLAIEWDDPSWNHAYDTTNGPTDFDGVKLLIDVDGDGLLEDGEDARMLIAASISSQYLDQHKASGNEDDRIGDGYGRLAYDAGRQVYQAEFRFPLSADSNNEDGNLSASSRYNLVLFDHVQLAVSTGNAGTAYVDQIGSGVWPQLPLVSAGAHSHPQLPTGLGGLIVFLSDHEVANREAYAYDPASGQLTRITTAPNLFKDGISLSHDRSRVAFFGAASETDYASYEIYTVNIDGSNLQPLTSNTTLDGHPAWSPDDSRIAYASFRDGGARATIVVMNADGSNPGPDLTPAPFDDNDPEYLPDGRIVFKTDRFQAKPQVQMAVMNEDGSNLRQLSFQSGVSDHDAVGNDSRIIFERFSRPTDYATDPASPFAAWDLVAANLDGSGEEILLADGFVNWLPVFSADGNYIAYQKSSGYTDLRLMTRQGEDLGRLIPDMTRIHYFDWK